MKSRTYLSIIVLCIQLILVSAQDGILPDSITDVDCMSLQMDAPHICCDAVTGEFCPQQCNNGFCRCVDPATGVPISDTPFPENDESVSCDLIIVSEATTTEATTTEATTTEQVTTAEATTDLVETVTDQEPATTEEEEPTTDDPEDESSDSSETSDSEETSFSSSDSDTSRSTGTSGTTKTNNTRSDETEDSVSISESTSGSETSGTTRTNNTRSDEYSGSKSDSSSRCPSVRRLLAKGCIQSCLLEGDDGCPACNRTCLDLAEGNVPAAACDCADNQVCLRVGRFGDPECVDLLVEGERCDGGSDDESSGDESEDSSSEDSESSSSSSSRSGLSGGSRASARRRVGGARDRYIFGTLNDAVVGCQEGLTCVQVDFGRRECRPDNSTENPEVGNGCTVDRAGQTFDVSHGDFFVNVDDCERCLCNNGEAIMCEPSVCVALQRSPPTCSYEGQTYTHGESFQVDCNTCGCRNGEIRCTRQPCEEFVFRDRCQECLSAPREEVCAINGVTYPSSCVATFCAGLAPFDVRQGNCPSMDVCMLYPCEEGDLCLRRGGVTCLDANGCDPDDLRICVNVDSLMCENVIPEENPESSDSNAVCGSNGVTYPSLCQLIQDTGNEGVAYAGPCDREECQGGPVCGTDGVTYENVCILRAQSANARVDFYGECEDGPGTSPEEHCVMVSRARRCSFDMSNCRHLVTPEEGCCALCGGIVFVAIDFAGLRDYVRINPRVRTLDAFAEVLINSGFINAEVTERCELEVSLTRTGNIQISLSARNDVDSAFCNNASERLASAINDPSSVSGDPQFAQVPEILQFASAAVAAPNAAAISTNEVTDTESGFNGAPFVKALSYFTLLLLVVTTVVAV